MRTADLKGDKPTDRPTQATRISPQRDTEPRQKSPVRGYSHPKPATINSPMN
jgi:hypothetical protein